MADNSFGIKELNLVGSGTPKIQSPNNINLEAVTVAISTNATVGGNLSVSGTLDVSGISTFANKVIVGTGATIEPNGQVIFAGIITANSGVRVNADSGNPGAASATNYFSVGASEDLKIYHNGGTNYIAAPNGDIQIKADTFQLVSDDTNARAIFLDNSNSRLELGFDGNHAIHVKATGTEFIKDVTVSTGATIQTNGAAAFAGTVTATGFRSGTTTGDGSDVAFATKYYITANGSSAYRFAGAGVLNTTDDPTLYFHRGFTYILENSTGGSHPFELRVSDGGSAYAPGGQFLTGSTTGTQILTVPMDAPASIVYQCTIHGSMLGTINFVQ